MRELVSFREYARRRGVTLKAVQKAIASGRITTVTSGKRKKIDPAVADSQWGERTDPAKQRVAEAAQGAAAGSPDPAKTFIGARAMLEAFRAKTAKLIYEQKAAKLVDAAQVKIQAFECARIVRNAIENIPNRIADELAAETDPGKVHRMLTEELHRALEELANAGRSANIR